MAKLIVDKDFRVGKIDKRIYGSFIEHLGRAVYHGIYEPTHPLADENGFRNDVAELVKEIDVPVVRYPGGNFVSCFNWEDSVGPRDQRPRRPDLAWHTIETNEVGVDEFMKWCKKVNTSPMMAVNLGTRDTRAAVNLLEYCNMKSGTQYSDMRIKNGTVDPHNIKLWCMGNEMDGPWQTGHKTAEEYGRIAHETAKAMKMLDSSIETVVCGSSHNKMATYPEWERKVLTEAYDSAEYISLHMYQSNWDNNPLKYFARATQMENFIKDVISTCDYVRAVKRGKKDINISFDEWNVWYHSLDNDRTIEPWSIAPGLLEDIYNHEDAIMNGLQLIAMLRHADRVKIACLAQLVNVIAPIMTENNGPAWRQTIFYPYMQASRYGRGTTLLTNIECDTYEAEGVGDVGYVQGVAIEQDNGDLTIFAVNCDPENSIDLDCIVKGYGERKVKLCTTMTNDDLKAINTAGNECCHPVDNTNYVVEGEKVTVKLPKVSWNVIVLEK